MNFKTRIGHAAAMTAASAAPSLAQSFTADGTTVDPGLLETVGAVGIGLIGVSALFGLVMLGTGALRIYNARAERRAAPPTARIKYSEGIWRILVGAGLIINGVLAVSV